MKRTFVFAVAATMGLGLCLGGHVHAQQYTQGGAGGAAAAPAQPLRTRIALVNLVQVLKNYKKFLNHQEFVKSQIQGINTELTKKKNELMALAQQIQAAENQEEKEALEAQGRQKEMALKADQEDANRKIAKMQGEAAVQIYKEVEEAVRVFAQVNDIELVLVYNDASKEKDPADYYSMNNVTRKMTTAPLMPMHWDPRMDITGAVVTMLNNKMTPQ